MGGRERIFGDNLGTIVPKKWSEISIILNKSINLTYCFYYDCCWGLLRVIGLYRAHNLKVRGSNPLPATNKIRELAVRLTP